jgi:hypothetical protein
MRLYLTIALLAVISVFAYSQIKEPTWVNKDGISLLKNYVYINPQNVTFINGNPKETQLGLCKFLDYNEETETYNDFELMDLRWNDKVKIVKLDPGHYAVTQYREMPGQSVLQKIKGFKEFDVEDEPIVVEFVEKNLILPNNVI